MAFDRAKPIDILIVEDSANDAYLIRKMVANIPERRGGRITVARTLAEGQLRLEEDSYSIILADLHLPDSDGISTINLLLASSNAPLLVLTDCDDDILSVQALRIGAQDYLSKTHLTTDALRRAMLYALERYRLHRHYRELLTRISDGILVVSKRNNRILFANPAMEDLYQRPCEQLLGEHFEVGDVDGQATQSRLLCGKYIELRVVETSWKAEPAQIVTLRDVTHQKRMQAQLAYLSHHDSLTGLANRTLLTERIHHAIVRAKRSKKMFAVLTLGLDRFKLVNDSLGHHVGDELLKAALTRIEAIVKKTDTFARSSGDEFVIVLENIGSLQTVAAAAQKVVKLMEEPFALAGARPVVTVSIGISLYPRDGVLADVLLKNSEAAMYKVKQSGRDNYQFFDKSVHRSIMQRLTLETELKKALVEKQFVLHYQPQFDDSRIVGAEALIRWRHPKQGLLPPGRFISILEQSGLIKEVEYWALETACKQLWTWLRLFHAPIRMAVNLSSPTLLDEQFPERVSALIKRYALPPGSLEIEITERLLLQDVQRAIVVLGQLKEMGILIALDDFGTGYSSLSYLQQFSALSTLKIDQSFVCRLNGDPRNRAIMTAMVRLGRSLAMNVVMEGVETTEQLRRVQRLKGDIYQGYVLSKPVPANDWQRYWSTWHGYIGTKFEMDAVVS